MDFNSHGMKAHFNDLERGMKPQLKEFKPKADKHFPIMQVASVIGVVVLVGLFLPLA